MQRWHRVLSDESNSRFTTQMDGDVFFNVAVNVVPITASWNVSGLVVVALIRSTESIVTVKPTWSLVKTM